jgi:ABC-type Zn uptake system ZnuABC Zn-binding protein ZnuA
MSHIKLIPTVVFTLFLFVGCNEKPKAVDPNNKDERRQSTKALEAADLVGYDGKRLRKTTDRILDANDKRNRDIQKTIDDNE